MIKRIAATFAAAILLLSLSVCAAASGVPDWTQDGKSSITIRINLPKSLNEYGNLRLYRVGDLHEDSGNYSFIPIGVFQEKWEVYEDLFSPQLARDLASYAMEQKVTYLIQKIGEDGTAVFTDLEFGLYLVVQEKPAEGYTRIEPFLIGLPNNEDGTYVYQVSAKPKFQPETPPTEPSEPSEPTELTEPTEPQPPDLPQTGQMNWPVPVLALTGVLLILCGMALCMSERKAI